MIILGECVTFWPNVPYLQIKFLFFAIYSIYSALDMNESQMDHNYISYVGTTKANLTLGCFSSFHLVTIFKVE